MTPQEELAARKALLGKTWALASGDLSEKWLCDNVNWNGVRCAVALNDGRGRYQDLDLRDWSPDGIVAFAAETQARLQDQLDERAVVLDFSDLAGEVI